MFSRNGLRVIRPCQVPIYSFYTFDDVKIDLGRLDVVWRTLVRAGVPGGGGARDRQPRVDGVAAQRRLHFRVARGRRRDPLAVSKPAERAFIIRSVLNILGHSFSNFARSDNHNF